MKASGLNERQAWEVAFRDAGGGATEVRLVFEDAEGDLTVGRSRTAKVKSRAKKADREEFRVTTSAGETLDDEDAKDLLVARGFPGWSDWKSSYCQHQEAARDRLIDKNNLSASLATLLGLDDILKLRQALDGLKLSTFKRQLKDRETRINQDLEDLLAAAGGLRDAQDTLERVGIQPETVTRDGSLTEAERLRQRAADLKEKLGVEVELPERFHSLEEARTWAVDWPAKVRASPGRYAAMGGLRSRAGALADSLAQIEPLAKSAQELKSALCQAQAEGGDLKERNEKLKRFQAEVEVEDAARKANSRLESLLRDAAGLLDVKPSETCPVCASDVPKLGQRVQERLAGVASKLTEALAESHRQACERVDVARRHVEDLKELQGKVAGVRERLEAETAKLTGQFPERNEGDDLVAAARAERERARKAIAELQPLQDERDRALEEHDKGRNKLKAMSEYVQALDRESQRVDVQDLPGWKAFQAALDRMAGLIVDCEALASLAKDLLKERSDRNVTRVNSSLDKYYSMIAGKKNARARGMRIKPHATAKKMSYKVLGADGNDLVPILNQASLNAISMAILFAQAEDFQRERPGPCLLVLDDPEQSLDAEHVAGLANAIEQAACHGTVLVGATPGRLAERIRDYVSSPKRLIHLNEWGRDTGSTIQQTEG